MAITCSAYEDVPSLNDVVITAGERLAVKIISAYLNRKFEEGAFPLRTAPVTALELGIYTDHVFGAATIDWARAVDHSREVIVGQYLERDIIPVVTGFDGINDPHNEFQQIMQTSQDAEREELYAGVYRTSLGRGGSESHGDIPRAGVGCRVRGILQRDTRGSHSRRHAARRCRTNGAGTRL